MKSIVNNSKSSNESIYPRLMINKQCGRIVLFEKPSTGIVVYKGSTGYDPVGYIANDFEMQFYVPFEGSITLSND